MRVNLGHKEFEELPPALRGLVEESPKVRSLSKVDHLIERVGIGIVQCVEKYYATWKEKPNEANRKKYLLWRLRLHRKLKNDRKTLDEINLARNLGLYDEEPGKLCWDLNFD